MENVLEQNILDTETFEFKPLKRTDIHRPSAIKPDEYEYVAFDYIPLGRYGGDIIGDCMFLQAQRERTKLHMARTGGKYSQHEHGGSCHVCGAGAIYTITFYHEPTNTYIRTGQDCAQKMEMSFGNFDLFKRLVYDARNAVKGKTKAQVILSDAGCGEAYSYYAEKDATIRNAYQYEEYTISDIVSKLVRYGSITDRAMNFVGSLLNKIVNRVAIAAKRAAEKEAAAPVPTGRFVIEGLMVSRKYKDDIAYPDTKIVVKHASGWCVYGTLPAALANAQVGTFVSFTATVKVSDKDPKFGFFSRPTGGKVGPTVEGALEAAGREAVVV